MEYIIILGAFQALLALCLFMANRQRKPADNLLTWILICLFTHLSIKFIIYAVSGNTQLKTAFNTFIDLAYGPLLWMYARKVKNDHYRPLQHWYLLLPAFIAAAIYTVISIRMIVNPGNALTWLRIYNESTQYLIMGSMFIFPLLSLQISNKLPSFWRSEQQLIRKVSVSFIIMTSIWMLTCFINALYTLDGPTVNILMRIIGYSNLLVICLFIIKYRLETQALNRAAAREDPPAAIPDFPAPTVLIEEKESLLVAIREESAPRKSTLTSLQQEAIAIKLSVLMLEKKIYTDPELTLEKLSSLIKTRGIICRKY